MTQIALLWALIAEKQHFYVCFQASQVVVSPRKFISNLFRDAVCADDYQLYSK